MTEKLNFKCYVILSNVNINISMWLMVPALDSTAPEKRSTDFSCQGPESKEFRF